MNPAILIALVGIGIIAGHNYLSAMNRAKAEIIADVKANIHELTFSGVKINVKILLKNPTTGSCSFLVPTIKVSYKDTVIASTNPTPTKIPIKANSTVSIPDIYLTVDYFKLLTTGLQLSQDLLSSKGASIKVRTLSTIYVLTEQIPFDQTNDFILKK